MASSVSCVNKVVIAARNQGDLDTVVAEIKGTGGEAAAVVGDVRKVWDQRASQCSKIFIFPLLRIGDECTMSVRTSLQNIFHASIRYAMLVAGKCIQT